MLANDFFSLINKTSTDGSFEALVGFNSAHFIYQAHFPGNPITPGVCILQIAKELLEQHVEKPLVMKEAKNIKYLQVLDPVSHPEVYFKLKIQENGDSIVANIIVELGEICFTKISASYINA